MIVTFFGHADFTEGAYYHDELMRILEDTVGDAGAEFHLGGYGSFDAFAYRCCKEYKANHPGVSLVYVTPYLTEQVQRSRLEEIATRYDVILYPALETVPPKAAIARRNEKMVDGADVVIVYVRRTHGGAAHALRHAQKASKRIYNLYSAEAEKTAAD